MLRTDCGGEASANYPNGPLYWSQLATVFIGGLISRHAAEPGIQMPGLLDKATLRRLRDYIAANVSEPIDVPTLAKIAGRSPFHFSRMFARSVGMSPHRYVVQLRLQRATELMREGRYGLAEIATCTGFADQSHLSRWVKRVHGVSPSQLTAD